jgi:hypothetical protein
MVFVEVVMKVYQVAEAGMIEVEISKELRWTYRPEDGRNIVFAWCCEQFGDPAPLGYRWNTDTYTKFRFQYEADAVLFSLKWSGR